MCFLICTVILASEIPVSFYMELRPPSRKRGQRGAVSVGVHAPHTAQENLLRGCPRPWGLPSGTLPEGSSEALGCFMQYIFRSFQVSLAKWSSVKEKIQIILLSINISTRDFALLHLMSLRKNFPESGSQI